MMRAEKGITLVALVITIIVMLILVGVSVMFAVNSGLFDQADNAVDGWKANETQEAEANFTVNNQNITDYVSSQVND